MSDVCSEGTTERRGSGKSFVEDPKVTWEPATGIPLILGVRTDEFSLLAGSLQGQISAWTVK